MSEEGSPLTVAGAAPGLAGRVQRQPHQLPSWPGPTGAGHTCTIRKSKQSHYRCQCTAGDLPRAAGNLFVPVAWRQHLTAGGVGVSPSKGAQLMVAGGTGALAAGAEAL